MLLDSNFLPLFVGIEPPVDPRGLLAARECSRKRDQK